MFLRRVNIWVRHVWRGREGGRTGQDGWGPKGGEREILGATDLGLTDPGQTHLGTVLRGPTDPREPNVQFAWAFNLGHGSTRRTPERENRSEIWVRRGKRERNFERSGREQSVGNHK